jgi:hypothetical protein
MIQDFFLVVLRADGQYTGMGARKPGDRFPRTRSSLAKNGQE